MVNSITLVTVANNLNYRTSEFIQKSISIHGNKFDYSKVQYIGSHTKVCIICPEHGEFYQSPTNHLSGNGCAKCAAQYSRGKYRLSTVETFLAQAKEIHGDKYEYSKVEWKNTYTSITIICPIHGEFEQTVQSHLRGQGCPTCAKTGFDKTKPAILYYLSINNGEAYKIGITNKSVKDRFNSTELKKITVLKEWEYPIGYDAYKAEQRILSMYKDFKYKGKAILATGNTELFTTNVLEIDTL